VLISPCWSDLEDKGYVVVPGFLPAPQIDALVDGFDRGRPPQDYPFGFKLVGRAPLAKAMTTIERALSEIRSQTRLKVDVVNFITLSHYITTRFAERSSFLHQDFDLDYKLTRDHLNYLNFWIPLRKPEVAKSNVTLIPFDALRSRSPAEYELLVGSGGNRFVPQNGKTAVFGNYGSILAERDRHTPERYLDFDLEEIAVTPPLAAGDLLLMRGDVIHRTQDIDSDRVAASLRATHSGKLITRARSLVDSGAKRDPAAANMDALLRSCFDTLGRSEITIEEFVRFSRDGSAATQAARPVEAASA
jgi:hypothetical protein